MCNISNCMLQICAAYYLSLYLNKVFYEKNFKKIFIIGISVKYYFLACNFIWVLARITMYLEALNQEKFQFGLI